MARLAFALECAAKIAGRQDNGCPYCGSARTRLIQRKNILLHLRKCDDCALMFRWPKPTAAASTSFNGGEPIVYRPEEALDSFPRTRMDLLAFCGFVLTRCEEGARSQTAEAAGAIGEAAEAPR